MVPLTGLGTTPLKPTLGLIESQNHPLPEYHRSFASLLGISPAKASGQDPLHVRQSR